MSLDLAAKIAHGIFKTQGSMSKSSAIHRNVIASLSSDAKAFFGNAPAISAVIETLFRQNCEELLEYLALSLNLYANSY